MTGSLVSQASQYHILSPGRRGNRRYMSELTTEKACEFLIRTTEINGSESFEKNFVKDDKILCSVFVFVGPHAEEITAMIREQLHHYGYHNQPPLPPLQETGR